MSDPYLDQPREVSLETLSLCNAKCSFCPYPTLERKGTRMPDELIDSVIRQMAEFKRAFNFTPFHVNEPLLDKRLIPILRRVNDEVPKADIRIFTNGQALTPETLYDIAQLKRVKHLWISLNDHRPEEYKKLMGLDFEKTAKRLDYLHSVDFPYPVMLSTVGFPNEDFRRYCFDRWPDFESTALKKDAWIDFTDPQYPEVPDTPCWRWLELAITATGAVAHCCRDGECKYPIGDIRKNTLLEIYNAPFWRERREKGMSRKALDSNSPCARCSY